MQDKRTWSFTPHADAAGGGGGGDGVVSLCKNKNILCWVRAAVDALCNVGGGQYNNF